MTLTLMMLHQSSHLYHWISKMVRFNIRESIPYINQTFRWIGHGLYSGQAESGSKHVYWIAEGRPENNASSFNRIGPSEQKGVRGRNGDIQENSEEEQTHRPDRTSWFLEEILIFAPCSRPNRTETTCNSRFIRTLRAHLFKSYKTVSRQNKDQNGRREGRMVCARGSE